MRLYNTLTRSEEEFTPGPDNTVRMYTCGLTVYARGHIGNFRTFVCVDVLRRTLRHLLGYQIKQVVNFTDVDDRTIAGAQKAGVDLRTYTTQYIDAFLEDSKALGLEAVEEMPRATDEANIRAMADLIAMLDRKGHTYRSEGSVYFKISTLPAYGRLAHLDHEGIKSGARVDSDNYAKEDARDFVLWKATKPGEPTWDLVEPAGRPGWHLECSAMALRLLGDPPMDIHTGGVDLIFPHHENEIAQSEGATGKPFSRFWMHVEHLLVDNEKMSKSLGNTFTIPDVVAKHFRPSALRLLLLSSHYRKLLNFSWTGLEQNEAALQRVADCLARVEAVTAEGGHGQIASRIEEARQAFSEAMQDDLNTAAALGAMFELVRALNSAIDAGEFGRQDVPLVREAFEGFDQVLGVLSLRRAEDTKPPVPEEEINSLIEARHAARRRRDFVLGAVPARAAASDRIRAAIIGMGGRGRDHMRELARIPFVEVAAFCDPDATRLDQRATEFETLTGKKPVLQKDVRKVLEDKSIDAVTIATCNHWHALAAIWACQAGKHVYVEKPVCHDFFSGAQMVAAARKYNRLVQGGTQRRSSGNVRRAIQALHEGIIGDVHMARCIHYENRGSIGFKDPAEPPGTLNWDLWVGPAPMQPYNANLHPYNWHWFWDFGNGELGNNGIHYIDVARWGLNKGLPSRIFSSGGRFGYKDQGQTPNVQLSSYVFDDGTELVMEIRGRFSNSEGGTSFGNMFYGSKGYMISDGDRGSFRVFLGGKTTPEPDLGRADDADPQGKGPVSHFRNFFDAVQAGKREMLTAEINETYLSTAFCLLGNISYRLKRELRFDPATRRFPGDHEADAMLKDKYRAPFAIPDPV